MDRSFVESTKKTPLQLACIVIAGLCAVWVLICLIVALATPWYRVSYDPPAGKSVTTEFEWEAITVVYAASNQSLMQYAAGHTQSYSRAKQKGLGSLTTFTLVMLVFAFICWVLIALVVLTMCVGSFIPGVGSKIPMAAGSLTSSLVCCAMCLMCISWVVYAAFFSTAIEQHDATGSGPWQSFTGTSDDTTWGPSAGWAFAMIACFCTCLVAIPFAIGTAKDVVVDKDNFVFIKGAVYDTV